MLHIYDQIQESLQFIRSKWQGRAKGGIVLGTGLGNLAKQIQADVTFPYE